MPVRTCVLIAEVNNAHCLFQQITILFHYLSYMGQIPFFCFGPLKYNYVSPWLLEHTLYRLIGLTNLHGQGGVLIGWYMIRHIGGSLAFA
jgi:hypothetical protein